MGSMRMISGEGVLKSTGNLVLGIGVLDIGVVIWPWWKQGNFIYNTRQTIFTKNSVAKALAQIVGLTIIAQHVIFY